MSHGKFRSHKHLFQTVIALNLLDIYVLTRKSKNTTNYNTNTNSVKNFITGKSFLQTFANILFGIIVKFLTKQERFYTQHYDYNCIKICTQKLSSHHVCSWIPFVTIFRHRILSRLVYNSRSQSAHFNNQPVLCIYYAIKYHMVLVVVLLL